MIAFSVGCTWENYFLDEIIKLNNIYREKGLTVKELYGSLRTRELELISARPDFRLPAISIEYFTSFVKRAHSEGIKINYTINAPLCQSINDIHDSKDQIINSIKLLSDFGVDVFTVGNSLLFEIISDEIQVPLEVSSVLHAKSVAQIPVYKKWNVSQVCMDVVKNRDISFLKSFGCYAKKFDIETKLIVNEFCNVNGAPCSGIYQADCVIHSSLGGNEKGYFDGWPFGKCCASRLGTQSSWLKSRFILPQWISRYNELTGISWFKITGRTCSSKWLLGVVEAYMSQYYGGDIRKLWVDPGNAPMNSSQPKDVGLDVLTASYLDAVNFIDHWFNNQNFRCEEHCGFSCNYCEKLSQKKERSGPGTLKKPLSGKSAKNKAL